MKRRFVATAFETDHEISVELLEDGRYRVAVDGRERVVDARRVESGMLLVPPGGGRVAAVELDGSAPDYTVTVRGTPVAVKVTDARASIAAAVKAPARGGAAPLRSPMPGKVVKLLAREGELVKAGQGIVVVEAMKMENELRAPRDGVVMGIGVAEGATVEANQVLATIGDPVAASAG